MIEPQSGFGVGAVALRPASVPRMMKSEQMSMCIAHAIR